MIKRVLLAYDGSAPASKAFDFAAQLAQRFQAELIVLTVAAVPEFAEDEEARAMIEHATAQHQKLLDGIKDKTAALGVPVRLELAVGHPAQQILAQAERLGADHIVLAHRGRGVLDRWRLGSVAHRVISYAECPVTVAR